MNGHPFTPVPFFRFSRTKDSANHCKVALTGCVYSGCLTGVLEEAVAGVGTGMEDEAEVEVEGPATVGVIEELALEVEDEAAAEAQLDGQRGSRGGDTLTPRKVAKAKRGRALLWE